MVSSRRDTGSDCTLPAGAAISDSASVHAGRDPVILVRGFQGSTDSSVFEEYIEQLLPLMGRRPEPKSVLVMDNASFHYTGRIQQMCDDACVKLVYLPLYSPDLNPVEEEFFFLAELKAFIKKIGRDMRKILSRAFTPSWSGALI